MQIRICRRRLVWILQSLQHPLYSCARLQAEHMWLQVFTYFAAIAELGNEALYRHVDLRVSSGCSKACRVYSKPGYRRFVWAEQWLVLITIATRWPGILAHGTPTPERALLGFNSSSYTWSSRSTVSRRNNRFCVLMPTWERRVRRSSWTWCSCLVHR